MTTGISERRTGQIEGMTRAWAGRAERHATDATHYASEGLANLSRWQAELAAKARDNAERLRAAWPESFA